MAYWYNHDEILPGGPCGHPESEDLADGACLMFEMQRGTRPRYTALSVLELRTLVCGLFQHLGTLLTLVDS